MAKNNNIGKGTDYEKFVQAVYQAVIDVEGVENITVQHNIELTGKSGCAHQIDVYWEFKVAGHTYKTAIECKSFEQTITIGKIRDFYGVVLDIPNLKGIFATRIGYQSGAKRYAEHYGIKLEEVRVPEKADWVGKIKDIHLTINAVSARVTDFAPRVSQAFRSKLTTGQALKFQWAGMSDAPLIFDKSGAAKISYNDIILSLPTGNTPAVGRKHFVPLAGDILPGNVPARPVKPDSRDNFSYIG